MKFIIASAAALLIAVPIAAQPGPSTAGEKAGATPDAAPTPPIRDRVGEAAGTSAAGNKDLPKKPPEMQHDTDKSTMPPADKPAEIPPPADNSPATPPG